MYFLAVSLLKYSFYLNLSESGAALLFSSEHMEQLFHPKNTPSTPRSPSGNLHTKLSG